MAGFGSDSLEATPHELPEAAEIGGSSASSESGPLDLFPDLPFVVPEDTSEEEPHELRLSETYSPEEAAIAARRSLDVQLVIEAAMAGTLHGHRALRYWEPPKLSHIHVQIALLMATGRRPVEIAPLVGMEIGRTRQMTAHPLVKRVAQAVMMDMGRQTTDLAARLDRTAPVMLDIIEEITTNPDMPAEIRSRNAFKWLDIAGYGSNEKHAVEHRVTIDSQAAALLSTAITESAGIQEGQWTYVSDGQREGVRRNTSGDGEGKSSPGSLDQEPAPSNPVDGSASLPVDVPTQYTEPARSSPRLLRAASRGRSEGAA